MILPPALASMLVRSIGLDPAGAAIEAAPPAPAGPPATAGAFWNVGAPRADAGVPAVGPTLVTPPKETGPPEPDGMMASAGTADSPVAASKAPRSAPAPPTLAPISPAPAANGNPAAAVSAAIGK